MDLTLSFDLNKSNILSSVSFFMDAGLNKLPLQGTKLAILDVFSFLKEPKNKTNYHLSIIKPFELANKKRHQPNANVYSDSDGLHFLSNYILLAIDDINTVRKFAQFILIRNS